MNAIINANFNGFNVSFRDDAYIHATAIAKEYNKRPETYLKTEPTKRYIAALTISLSTTLQSVVKENQLVIVKNGGNNRGTWLHPKLAIDFARWLSPEFAVWCDEQIENIINHKNGLIQQTINAEQQFAIKEAVNLNVHKTGRTHQAVYRDLYQQFRIPKYQDLLAKDFDYAIQFLGSHFSQKLLSDEDWYYLACLYESADRMRFSCKQIEPALRLLNSNLNGTFWSMSHDYDYILQKARNVISRETAHIKPKNILDDWNKVLHVIR